MLWDFDRIGILRLKHASEPILTGLLGYKRNSDDFVHFFTLVARKCSSFQVLQDGRFEEILSIMIATSSKVRNLNVFAYIFDV